MIVNNRQPEHALCNKYIKNSSLGHNLGGMLFIRQTPNHGQAMFFIF